MHRAGTVRVADREATETIQAAQRVLTERVGLTLQWRVLIDRRRANMPRGRDCAPLLLHDMAQLVRKQIMSGRCVRCPLPRRDVDLAALGERQCAEVQGSL